MGTNKDAYKNQIKRIQELITKVTEKSVSIQAKESRNKKLVEEYFSKKKHEIRQGRQASKTVLNYYKSMSDTSAISSQIMDQKNKKIFKKGIKYSEKHPIYNTSKAEQTT